MVTKTKRKPTGAAANGAGPGRPKGMPNKLTVEVKQMILDALALAGGVQYLADRAIDTPGPFLTLVGKVLPLQITGANGGPVQIARIELVALEPKP